MQVSPRKVILDSQGLSKEAQKALKKYSLTGDIVSPFKFSSANWHILRLKCLDHLLKACVLEWICY